MTNGLFQKKQIVKAVDDVTFDVYKGETFGLVGESGCGKSTLGRTIVKINPVTSGKVLYDGEDITKLKGDAEKKFRKRVQMIFQDPYASLNPRMTVGEIIREPMVIHNLHGSQKEQEERVVELLQIVILTSFPVDRDSVSPSREHWHWILSLLSVMSRSPHWMFPFRRRSSTC